MNLKDGSYQTQPSPERLQRLALDYSSRRNVTGVFGAGWCSELDREIRPGRGDRFELRDCDRITRFEPVKTTALANGPKTYVASDDDGNPARLERNANGFRVESEQRRYRFDKYGQLTETTEDGATVYRRLDDRRVGGVRSLRAQVRGELMDLTFKKDRLTRLSTPKAPALEFRYDGARLVAVNESALKITTEIATYAYDTEDNMTQESRDGGNPVFIGYDRRADRVRTVRGQNECAERYDYDHDAGPPNGPAAVLTERSRVIRQCPTTEQLILQIENDYLRTETNELLLTESRRISQDQILRRRFHPLLGSVESERREPNPQSHQFAPVARPKTRLASE